MKKLNRNGFTLVELLATIVILALVTGFGSYAITGIIKSSKEEDYELLVKNIKDGVENYYLECKYADNSGVDCSGISSGNGSYETTLGNLVKYGFIKGNSQDDNGKYTLVNPMDNKGISDCKVSYRYENGKIVFNSVSNGNTSCPDVK